MTDKKQDDLEPKDQDQTKDPEQTQDSEQTKNSEQTKDKVAADVDQAKEDIQEAGHKAKEQLSQAAEASRQQAGKVANLAKEQSQKAYQAGRENLTLSNPWVVLGLIIVALLAIKLFFGSTVSALFHFIGDFLLTAVHYAAWPLVVLVIVYYYRHEIRDLLNRLGK